MEHVRKQQVPKETIASSDTTALKEFDQKTTLFEIMTKSKSFNKSPKQRALYHALMESILEDKDAMDEGVADKLKKRKQDDADKDEGPSTRSDQGLKRWKTSKDIKPSKKAKSTESSKGTSKSQQKSTGKSAQAKETVFTAGDIQGLQNLREERLGRNIPMYSYKLYKFSDSTLISLRDTLKDMANNLEMGYTSVMSRRRLSSLDKKRFRVMIKDIDSRLEPNIPLRANLGVLHMLSETPKLLSGIEDSHHGPSDVMHNPPQPLKSSAISDVQALPLRKLYCQIYQVVKHMLRGKLLASFQDHEHEGGDTRSQGGIKDNDVKIKIQDHNMQMISQMNSQEQGSKIQERYRAKSPKNSGLAQGYSSNNYVRKFLRALHLKWRANVMTIEESKDLTSLSLDELNGNLKVHKMIIKKDSKIVKAKGERKSQALKDKKESNDEESSTS
uniref:UBN2 domain-containing protein n=1 Tax=Tanacetum cinerariifolium TaxID=118510 RepID=A0A6L2NLP8_TANCI|nr:UBN2 domain-containing protein [Tanacetum cinerariifolium]